MEELVFLLGVVGIIIYCLVRNLTEKYRPPWNTVEIYIEPEAGIDYVVKERKGKYKYYIYGIRVPEKIFDWL